MRTAFRFLFSAIGLLLASALVKGIHHGGFLDLVVVAILLGVLNATLGTLLKFLAFIPVLLSFGCFSLIINGAVFYWAGRLSKALDLGFSVDGFWSGFFGALITSFTAWILELVILGKERKDAVPPEGPRSIKIVH